MQNNPKELSDVEIQSLLEEHRELEQTANVQRYQKVFGELAKPPTQKLDDLALSVVEIIIHRNEWRNFLKSILISIGVIIIGGFALTLVIIHLDSEMAKQLLFCLNSWKWAALLIVLVVVATEAMDRRWIVRYTGQIKSDK